jgi:hypothetical protein
MPSFSLQQQSAAIDKYLFLFHIHAITFSFMSSRISPSHSTHALSHSSEPVSLRSLYEKAMKYFYTRQREERKRIVAYKNEIEEKSGQ